MANPTTAKPTARFFEADFTAGTIGENLRCFCSIPANGPVRDAAQGDLAQPVIGATGMPNFGTGHSPALIPTGYTQGGVTGDPVLRFVPGAPALWFPNGGFTVAPTATTFVCEFKATFGKHSTATRQVSLLSVGDSGSNQYGLGLQVAADSTLLLGRYYQTQVTSSTVAITEGKTYLVALTRVTTTSYLINVYCRDDQAYVTPSGTGTTFAVSGSPGATGTGAWLNCQPAYDTAGRDQFRGDVYMAAVFGATFDPAANTFFAQLVTDPHAPVRASYTATGVLAAGAVQGWDTTPTSVVVNSNRPTLGTAGNQDRYQYRLHKSSAPSFTPDATTRVTGLQSSPILVDTAVIPGVTAWYKVEQTDGTATVYSTTNATRSQDFAAASFGDFNFLLIGDSREAGPLLPSAVVGFMASVGVRSSYLNHALAGSSVKNATASLSWQPNTTQDPVNGQASTTLLSDALGQAALYGITRAVIMLGVNDTDDATTFVTNYTRMLNVVLASGITDVTIVKAYPDMRTEAGAVRCWVNGDALEAFDNGNTIRVFGGYSRRNAARNVSTLSVDNLHYIDRIEGNALTMTLLRAYFPRAIGHTPTVIGG